MKCFQCNREFHSHGIMVSSDADFVCSNVCKEAYNKEKEHFFDIIIKDPEKIKNWLTSKE